MEKFEISQEEYEKRSDSVRAYKQRHKIGRFAEKKEEDIALEEALEEAGKELCQSIQIGNRCLVDTGSGVLSKKGSVKYVGQVEFQKGYWVGIQYDEPLGKHNGTYVNMLGQLTHHLTQHAY